jgi:hypothetical protein
MSLHDAGSFVCRASLIAACFAFFVVVTASGQTPEPPGAIPPTESANEASSSPTQEVPTPTVEQSFVGTNQCFVCHRPQANAWSETTHAQAYSHLPERYQGDSSCLSCHVTGPAAPGEVVLEEGKDLRMVGCESCHGPGAQHIDAAQRFVLATTDDAQLEQQIRRTIVKTPGDDACLRCHTPQSHGAHPVFQDPRLVPAEAAASTPRVDAQLPAPQAFGFNQTRYVSGYNVKTCGSCHYDQYLSWKHDKHSALGAMLPVRYVEDASCRSCHPAEAAPPTSIAEADALSTHIGVSCELCHGPAFEHVRFNVRFIHGPPLGMALEKTARESIRKGRPVATCLQCHMEQKHLPHPQFEK